MATTPDRTISYPPGDSGNTANPLSVDHFQKVVGVHWPTSEPGGGPSHFCIQYQSSSIPDFGQPDHWDHSSHPNEFIYTFFQAAIYLHYETTGVWAIVGAGVTVAGFASRHSHPSGGIPSNLHGASVGNYAHSANLIGIGANYGVPALFTIFDTLVSGPTPTRTGLRSGPLQAFYSRGPGRPVLDTVNFTAGVTAAYGGIPGTLIGHVVAPPWNPEMIEFETYDDLGNPIGFADWPGGNYFGSVGYEVYRI